MLNEHRVLLRDCEIFKGLFEALDSAGGVQDTVNLPNLANMFWEHADEERGHAIQFMKVE